MKRIVVSVLFILLSANLSAYEQVRTQAEEFRIWLDAEKRNSSGPILEKLDLEVWHMQAQVGTLERNRQNRYLINGIDAQGQEILGLLGSFRSWGDKDEMVARFREERGQLKRQLTEIAAQGGSTKSVYVALNRNDIGAIGRAKTIVSLLKLAGVKVYSLFENETGSIPIYLSKIDNPVAKTDFVLMLLFPSKETPEEYRRASHRLKTEAVQTVFPVEMGSSMSTNHPEIAAVKPRSFNLENVHDINEGILSILTAMGITIAP